MAIDDWVQSNPFIFVQEDLFSVSSRCNVRIKSLQDPPCNVELTVVEDPNSILEPDLTGAIIVIAALVVCALIAVVTIIVLRRKAKAAKIAAV